MRLLNLAHVTREVGRLPEENQEFVFEMYTYFIWLRALKAAPYFLAIWGAALVVAAHVLLNPITSFAMLAIVAVVGYLLMLILLKILCDSAYDNSALKIKARSSDHRFDYALQNIRRIDPAMEPVIDAYLLTCSEEFS
jgi:hypothetical protein